MKALNLIKKIRHSPEFLNILTEGLRERAIAIRAITHSTPLLVFWVDQTGKVIDALNAHHDNPPNGDRSVLSDPNHKGHLRGRATFIGGVIYIVIYGKGETSELAKWQQALLKRSYPSILKKIKEKNPNIIDDTINSAQFISEIGDSIL